MGITFYNLPPRQRQVLHFIVRTIEDKQESPTLQEIADANNMQVAQAQQIVNALEAKGKIKTTPHAMRSIEIVGDKDAKLGA